MTSEQITSFTDQVPAYTRVIASNPDPTFSTSDNAVDSLQGFFARPIKIADYSWISGTSFHEPLNPWTAYFSNKRVLNRIANYYLLRCKLHVKFTINGNAFFQGRMLVSYRPVKTHDNLSRNQSTIYQDKIAASQRPSIFLNPTTSQGGDMILPFFYPQNYLEITSSQWSDMGELMIQDLNPLIHATAAAGETFASISVFAWASDVEISVPTSVNPDTLLPQAGDEYAVGPISRPASIVARAAGALTNAPAIAPYARATQMAANAASAAAVAFGYSRPVTVDEPMKVKLVSTNTSNTNVPENVHKLSLDVKQELTIDSRTVGLNGDDEMDFKSIASRQSYLTSFSWTKTHPAERRLFSSVVDPMMYDLRGITSEPGEVYLTPVAFVAMPFRYWRGSLRYRFQIVANGFHRGRLKIVYDPAGNATSTSEYNTAHTYIVDIAETQDFSIDVGWGSKTSYRPRYVWNGDGTSINPMPTTKLWRTDDVMVAYAPTFGYGNGTIAVYIVNPLTASTDNASQIDVNVYVSACPDFEVAEARDISYHCIERLEPQAALVPQSGEELVGNSTTDEDHPEHTSTHIMLPGVSPTDMTNCVFFGETVTSFRQLIKRYSMHSVYRNSMLAQGTYYTFASPSMPPWTTLIDGPSYVIRNRLTLVQYAMSAFLGWRGSLRWKLAVGNSGQNAAASAVYPIVVTRQSTTLAAPIATAADLTGTDDQIAIRLARDMASMQSGACITTMRNEPIVEIELPYYSQDRFSYARTNNPATSHADLFVLQQWYEGTSTGPAQLITYFSVGEDFSTFFFICAPTLYFVV